MADDGTPAAASSLAGLVSAGASATLDATTALSLNRNVGQLVDSMSSSNSDVIDAIDGIASAVTNSLIGGTTGTVDNRLLRAKGTSGLALENSPIACDDNGNLTGVNSLQLPLSTRLLVCSATTNPGALSTPIAAGTAGQPLLSNGSGAYPSFQVWVDGIAGFFAFPLAQSYRIWLDSPFSGTITSTTTICTTGTCTATFQINGTNIGGTANSVSTSQNVQAHTSGNTFAVGDDIAIVISSLSSCQNMSFMITFTRP